MLDYALIRALAAVVREGSFDRAAQALHVTPSAVSQRIKLLEERVGTVLVVRSQPCTATEVGAHLCRHAELVGMLEDDLHGTLQRVQGRAQGGGLDGGSRPVLRVAVNADSLGTWFMGALAAFAAESPNALLDVALDDQDHTAEWLRRGQVLAAVTSLAEPVQGCRSRPIGRLRYVATASPAFVERHFADGVTPRALRAAPALRFNEKDQLQHRWLRRVTRQSIEPPTHRFPATQAFVDGVLAGLGWGMNPLALVRPHLDSGRMVELLPGRPIDVPLYWQDSRLAVPMLERLGACVARVAKAALRAERR